MIKLLKDDEFYDLQVVEILKKQYNENLKRIKKAEIFFKGARDVEVEKHTKMFLDLFEENNKLLNEYKNLTGLDITLEILEEGF